MNLDWEEIQDGMNRAKVPGGWLVNLYAYAWNERCGEWYQTLVGGYFVPDPLHLWGRTNIVAIPDSERAQP